MKTGVIIAGSGRGSAFAREIIEKKLGAVRALVDTNTAIHASLRKRLHEEFGSPETEIMTNLGDALAKFPKEAAPAVFIVTPNNTHASLLKLALEAGRDVMLEKPVGASQTDLEAIAALARKFPANVIHLGFCLRYSPFWRKIHEVVDSGRLGTIGMIQTDEWIDFAHSGNAYRRGWRRSRELTGGFLNEKCSHDLDLLCWYKEREADPVRIYSVAGTGMFEHDGAAPERCAECSDPACPFRWKEPKTYHYQLAEGESGTCVFHSPADIFNIQSATVTFSDGTQAIHTLLPYAGVSARRRIVVHGTRGFLRGEVVEDQGTYLKGVFYYESGKKEFDLPLEGDTGTSHGGGDAFLLNGFFDCVETRRIHGAGLYDGLRASLLAFAADESAETNQSVELTPRLERFADLRKR